MGALARQARDTGGRGHPRLQFRLCARRPGGARQREKPAAPAKAEPRRKPAQLRTLNGIDVLVRQKFAPLKGLRLGLITNHTGQDRDRNPTIDLLKNAPGVELKVLFSPEHGIRGAVDERVGDSVDEKTGLPVYSLYGERLQAEAGATQGPRCARVRHPGHRLPVLHLHRHDGPGMEAAGENGKKYFVLDRVNPINAVTVDGPVRMGKEQLRGLPRGAAALWHDHRRAGANVQRRAQLKADLTVIQVENWRRDTWFDQTGLPWTNPSPNMRSLTEAILYPGIGLLESALSVGRAPTRPSRWSARLTLMM